MRSIILLTFILILSTSILHSQVKIQSGVWSVNPSVTGYSLDKNAGDRTVTLNIEFPKPFEVKPTVIISISQIDVDKNFNGRYNVEPISVSRDGFTLSVKTWADSRVYGLSGYWIAYTESK